MVFESTCDNRRNVIVKIDLHTTGFIGARYYTGGKQNTGSLCLKIKVNIYVIAHTETDVILEYLQYFHVIIMYHFSK